MITMVGRGGQGGTHRNCRKPSGLVTQFDSYVFVNIFFENSPETTPGTNRAENRARNRA